MYMRINNILLGAFIVFGLAGVVLRWRKYEASPSLYMAWPVLAFFLLAVLASFRSWDLEGFKYLEKYWSLLLVPLVIFLNPKTFSGQRREIFLALLWGCIATLAICYVNLFWEMAANGEPLYFMFRWRHVGHQFTAIADTHPTYLGLFVVTSIMFLVQEAKFPKPEKYLVMVFLILGLFQLASRMALLLFLLFFIYLVFNRMKQFKWKIATLFLGILLTTAIFMFYGSSYMANRLFTKEAFADDQRFERWQVTYDIFREHPYIGVGYAEVKVLRKKKYLQENFQLAAEEEYNAHNQFLEYLSTDGAIGGFVYGISMMYLFFLSLYKRDVLFSFVFMAFILANLTESMMVRIKGIEYFAILTSLFLCWEFSKTKEV